MIVIAFDFGTKYIGVAVGENITQTGRALEVLNAQDGHPNWNMIKHLFDQWKPDLTIVGLPLNLDGTTQHITYKAQKFAYLLQYKFNMLVKMHDERLSTFEARSILLQRKKFKKIKNNKIHSLSAIVILESWFFQLK